MALFEERREKGRGEEEGGRGRGREKREETESFQMPCRTLEMVKLGPSGGGGSTGVPGHVEAEKIMNITCRKKGTFILPLFTTYT